MNWLRFVTSNPNHELCKWEESLRKTKLKAATILYSSTLQKFELRGSEEK